MVPPPDSAESDFLAAVVADLAHPLPKLVYADWLEERGDARGPFLRAYARSLSSGEVPGLPPGAAFGPEWLRLTGYLTLWQASRFGAWDARDALLRLARPAVKLGWSRSSDRATPVGASKVGGHPDLPPGFAWPTGADCRGTDGQPAGAPSEPAGFLGQINFKELKGAQAARVLPAAGVLSVFGFVRGGGRWDGGTPEVAGARAYYFPSARSLRRVRPPTGLGIGEAVLRSQRIRYEQVLDFPHADDPAWPRQFAPGSPAACWLEALHFSNYQNLLGYPRAPRNESTGRHFLTLQNARYDNFHLAATAESLAARDFDAVHLARVDSGIVVVG